MEPTDFVTKFREMPMKERKRMQLVELHQGSDSKLELTPLGALGSLQSLNIA